MQKKKMKLPAWRKREGESESERNIMPIPSLTGHVKDFLRVKGRDL